MSRFPFTAFCITILICSSSATSISNGRSDENEVCETNACKSAVKDLKRCMDTTVNPCEDFYQFTCGKFMREAKIPDEKESFTALTEVQNKLDAKLRGIFDKKECKDCPFFEKYLREYYTSCMDAKMIQKEGASEMLKMLGEFGGWPMVVDSWNESKADLTNIVTTMLKYRLMGLFDFHVYNLESNSSVRTIVMYQQYLAFPKDYYGEKKQKPKFDAFKKMVNRMAKHLSGNKTDKMQEVNEIVEFEKKLAEIMYEPDKLRLETQNMVALSSLAKKFDKVIDIRKMIDKLFEDVKIKIDPEEPIGIYGMDYFDKLANLLNETPKRTLVNYLSWQMFIKLSIALPTKFEELVIEFEKVASGISKMEPRWKRCTSLVTRELYKPLGALYAKTYFGETAKKKVKNIINEIRKTFKDVILNVTWLTNSTKSLALKKLKKIREHVGYPDYYDEEKEKLFKNMFDKIKGEDFQSKSFLRKHLDFLEIVSNENLKLLRKIVEPHKPDMEVAVINAFYNPPTNAIVFPAGILQWPFFSEVIPMYLNYGGIGYVIGHEITHGFDDEGHKYDEIGNLHNWWKTEDIQKFADTSKCMAELYSTFVVKELDEKVNGNLTLGENIADNGGLRAAFMAYQSWVNKNGPEPKLPDLDYTPDQLFFINFGRTFCQKTRQEVAAVNIRTDYHAPTQFRVMGSLINMKEFSEVFNCSANSAMNPENKCRVW